MVGAGGQVKSIRKTFTPSEEGGGETMNKYDGKKAYELRASGLSWLEVSQQIGLPYYTTAWQIAKRYAQSNGLPWLKVDVNVDVARVTTLREEGKTWEEIAKEMGVSKYILRGKTSHIGGHNKSGARDRHNQMAALRKEGKTWQEIATILGYKNWHSAHSSAAMRYRGGDQWPLSCPKKSKGYGHAAPQLAQAVALHSQGKTWDEVAAALGYASGHSLRSLANQAGLTNPLPTLSKETLEEVIAFLNEGKTWDEAAVKFRYSRSGLQQAVRAGCKRHGVAPPSPDRKRNRPLPVRHQKILELRKQGKTYTQIAQALGYSSPQVVASWIYRHRSR
jgi:transcriptional regulator